MIVHVHYLQILNTSGIIICALWLILFFLLLKTAFDKKNTEQFALVATILTIGFFIPEITGNLIINIVFFFALISKGKSKLAQKTKRFQHFQTNDFAGGWN